MVEAVSSEPEVTRQRVTLRLAAMADSDFLLELRNEPSARAQAFSHDPVSEEVHRRWLAATLSSHTRSLFVVEIDGTPVGMGRLDRNDETNADVSISLMPTARGRRLGVRILEMLTEEAQSRRVTMLHATIRADNERSIRAFARAGYGSFRAVTRPEGAMTVCSRFVARPRARTPKVIFFVNVDTFFVSHRMKLALALRDRGLEVAVAASDTGASAEIRRAGLPFFPLPLARGGTSPFEEARTVAAIIALYRAERPDVVHHASIKALMYGSWAAQLAGVPHVVNTISGLGYAMIQRPGDPLRKRALRRGVMAGYRVAFRANRVVNVFQNPDQRELFLDLGLVPKDSTRLVIGSGVDTDRFTATPLPRDERPLVVVPARLLVDKGVVEFVEAAKMLRARGSNARFVLVGGPDPDNPAAIPPATVDAWVRDGAVESWGHRTDMPEVMRQATLVVLPSYAEGLPLALAEGAATGRPCITTDVPGCREVVVHGETGWRVPVRDAPALARAMEDALSDRDRLQRFGARARDHAVERLSLRRVIDEMVAIYAELLGGRWTPRDLGPRSIDQ